MGENPDTNEIRTARLKAVASALADIRSRLVPNDKDHADAPYLIGHLASMGWQVVRE